MSWVQLEPADTDGVTMTKALCLDNAAIKKLVAWLQMHLDA